MKNITVKIDDEIYRRAHVHAAEMDTSVSAIVRNYLEKLGSKSDIGSEESSIATRRERLEKLWDRADARDREKTRSAGTSTREEIYEERLR